MPIISINPPKNNLNATNIDKLDYTLHDKGEIKEYNNIIINRSGFCFKNFIIIPESQHLYKQKWIYHSLIAYGSILKRPIRALDADNVYCISHNIWSNGYFHWMTEAVPRLFRLEGRAKELSYIAPPFPRLSRVVRATVSPLGFKKFIEYPPESNIKVERLVLPPNPKYKGEFDPEAMNSVRNYYLSRYGATLKASERPEYIYVTRRKARVRKIANEAELEALLHARGFATIAFEDYSFAEQVSLMSGAKVLISIVGAGLTNLMFMPPGGTVIEFALDPDKNQKFSRVRRSLLANPSYCRLSSIMGLNYFLQFCQPAFDGRATPSSDIVVDLKEFKEILDAALDMAS